MYVIREFGCVWIGNEQVGRMVDGWIYTQRASTALGDYNRGGGLNFRFALPYKTKDVFSTFERWRNEK
jgi:hypothetical protein